MKVCFISNYFNHHQLDLCMELNRLLGNQNFHFVETIDIPHFRKKLGYKEYKVGSSFRVNYLVEKERAQSLIADADIVINTQDLGDRYFPDFGKKPKIVFWYNERLFKEKNPFKWLPKWVRAALWFRKRKTIEQYCLSASAFGKRDFQLLPFLSIKSKCFKWGYFPHVDEETVLSERRNGEKIRFLFVGRLIKWKRPEKVILTAEYLRSNGIGFEITVVGDGPLREKLICEVRRRKLDGVVKIVGSVDRDLVCGYYRDSDYLLFTSTRKEGWGAVLNEAMAYGCVPIASKYAGSSLFLVKDGVNGFLFGRSDEFILCLDKAVKAFENQDVRIMAESAKSVIAEKWNGRFAAQRFVLVAESILSGDAIPNFPDGPMKKM